MNIIYKYVKSVEACLKCYYFTVYCADQKRRVVIIEKRGGVAQCSLLT